MNGVSAQNDVPGPVRGLRTAAGFSRGVRGALSENQAQWQRGDRRPSLRRGATLEEVRRRLPPGLYNIGRYQDDEPQIKEVWI